MTKKTIKYYQSKHVLVKSDIPYVPDEDYVTGVLYEIDGIIRVNKIEGTIALPPYSISIGGENSDADWTVSYNVSQNVMAPLTLRDTGVTPGQYPKVTVDTKGRVTSGSALVVSDIPGRASANGIATLDSNGKIPLSQLSDAILGQVIYQGTWDAATNSPTLPAIPTNKGDYYVVSAAANRFGIDFQVGDWIISNGTAWEKVDNTDAVTSVAGKIGAVVLDRNDVGLSNVDNTSDLNKPISNATQTALNGKVDKVAGKQLSTEDYTTAEKTKLAGIEAGAQVNVATNLSIGQNNANTLRIDSSTGTNVVLNSATTSLSGLLSSTDKQKIENIEAEISKSVPAGSLGQLPFIKIEGTRETEQDYILKVGQFVTNDTELNQAQLNIVSNQEIFNTWYRYSHNSSDNQPANASELNGWSYNAVNDMISSTINSATHIGFVSTKRYSSYTHEVKVWSTNSDDDDIGILLAFDVDPVTGREFTLTAIRSPGGTSVGTWSIWYNYMRSDQWRIANGTPTVAWGNGGFGSNASQAGYIVNSSGTGWVNETRSTRILAIRQDDIFTVTTTQLGSDTLDTNTTLTFSLTSDPRLTRFRGPKPYGYMAHSQAAATYQVISFSDTANIIYDLRTDTVYTYQTASTSWIVDNTRSLYTDVGYGRFIHNPDTKRTFYINRDNTFTEVVSSLSSLDDIYLRLTGGTINGNLTVTGNVISQNYDTSSIRYKDSVVDVKNIDDVLLLSPKYYYHKLKNKYEYGLIAEDVDTVYPEIVLKDKTGFSIGIDYSKLTVMLLAKIKSMDEEIKQLKNK